jgi:hypothetical protein
MAAMLGSASAGEARPNVEKQNRTRFSCSMRAQSIVSFTIRSCSSVSRGGLGFGVLFLLGLLREASA